MSAFRLQLGSIPSPDPGSWEVALWTPGQPLPFADESVGEIFAAHYLEAFANYRPLLHEIVRICPVGAIVRIRFCHPLNCMAMCAGHACVISPKQVRHWCEHFVNDHWQGCKRRLAIAGEDFIPGEGFEEAKDIFPLLLDGQILRLIPNACHEVRYEFRVVQHEG